jgi:EpsI family protein
MSVMRSWAPAAILAAGVVLVGRVDDQRRMPLREPLGEAVPSVLEGRAGHDLEIAEGERATAGMTSYVLRAYGAAPSADDAATAFTLYVGYYDSQQKGKTIHSPRNCLPGAGWEPLAFGVAAVATAQGAVTVNRYLIQHGQERALVLYWYQGRGRVEANEYAVKLDLLRDAALRGRSEEALVRVLVPVRASEAEAFELARRVAATVIPAVDRALPAS